MVPSFLYDESVNMAKGSKTANAIAVMTANSNKPMAEVIPLIATASGVDERLARNYYLWVVRKGLANGNIEKVARSRKVADKIVKSVSKGAVKASKKSTKEVVEKSADEIAAIKAKNLETLRKVTNRNKKVRDYDVTRLAAAEGEGVKDFDPQLAREEVDAILADEGMKKYIPSFMRD
jgi:hypothetical protein